MKKTLIITTITIGVIAIFVGVYFLGQFLNQPSKQELQKAQEHIEEEFNTAETDMPEDEQIDLLERFPNDLPESHMQAIIHSLSHQKVRAKYKRGVYQLTQERVERLLEVSKLNVATYQHGEVYVEILTNWSQGDFSQAHVEHNKIWGILDGEVGEAEGLLSPVEEAQYIELHFKNKKPKEVEANEEDTEE
ncbi:DUF6241 domain-containing protein [Ureibacillus aquaedulcis]|uniref:DUF6241 domain-containing protein n=1 Tax=Ureibacillus aquaedulcis TaxID=3058421 RepID=A0ABT8GN94_9BACL|nr:DUF6241 domain-containing protein [Ureibacillus sp. BA0131]MDN4492880.1 DUF6241 domain-containing protein [Ureibacillus sp. BA0131]